MLTQRWLLYAIASALAAALVGIFGKVGMKDVDPAAGTVWRSAMMTAFLLAFALISGVSLRGSIQHPRAWLAIAASGIAGAISWLFYFRALQLADVSKVAPIDKLSMPIAILLAVLILGERPAGWNWLGIALIAGGAYLAAIKIR